MADIIVTVGVEQKKRINLELQARKSLDGNILIFDHKEIDIVIMPLKRKIVTFAKSEINDSVYEVQNRFFNFLKRKGLVEYESIRGGNVYGSIEALICESSNPEINAYDYTLYGVYNFLKEETPYYDYMDDYEKMLDDYFVSPTQDDSTELGEVPQAVEKGSIRPGYNHEPYWMSYMLEGKERSTNDYLDTPEYIAAAKRGEAYARANKYKENPPDDLRARLQKIDPDLTGPELTNAEIGFRHGFDFAKRNPSSRGNWGLGLKAKREE